MADVPEEVREYFSRLGKATAKSLTPKQRKDRASSGGSASSAAMTAEARTERARNAVNARWARVREAKKEAEKAGGRKR